MTRSTRVTVEDCFVSYFNKRPAQLNELRLSSVGVGRNTLSGSCQLEGEE